MPTSKPKLTQTRLKELLRYDPETGHFTRLVSRGGVARAGSRAGTIDAAGYCQISIDGKKQYAHRLAFLYMAGELPPVGVDHINRVRGDNRWSNLRRATQQENAGNLGPLRNNTSGHRGVSWRKQRGKWRAYGKRDGRMIHLGHYTSLKEAADAAQKWREENFGVFAAA